MPSRRRLLAMLGTTVLAATGGCLTAAGRDLPVREVDGDSYLAGAIEGFPSSSSLVVAVGDRRLVPAAAANLPVAARVWNDTGDARTVRLRLEADDSGVVFDRTATVSSGAAVTVDLREPDDYRLLWVDGDDVTVLADVPEADFDCNETSYEAAIRPDATVETSHITTTLGCGPLSRVPTPF
ncbi:hypothetical protein Hbl1158_12740 [Halobaculum sp. CBA1158]|uniref:hypothetical protein n=1 Tax=Halobaculum sp. CBA1158 TaxID=2904243 RepID=UPI001F20920D|nr:hypothetical protein [Halobaculum sp. CBA1158]UIO99385.1 hypothetical protein Hbl1158_12740 [Halobaculum sp. CBA1158]